MASISADFANGAHKSSEAPVAVSTCLHSIQLSQNEWQAMIRSAERQEMVLGALVGEATACAAIEAGGFAGALLWVPGVDLV